MNKLAGPLLYVVLALGSTVCTAGSITWKPWSEAVFEQLRHAENAEHFIHANFAGIAAGYDTAAAGSGALARLLQCDENTMMARFANLLARYAGNDEYLAHAQYAMRFLVTPEVAPRRRSEAGILIADAELAGSPKKSPPKRALSVA